VTRPILLTSSSFCTLIMSTSSLEHMVKLVMQLLGDWKRGREIPVYS